MIGTTSVVISLPKDLASFKGGNIHSATTFVKVEQSASPTLMDQPKYFSGAANKQIEFVETDFRGNRVTLHPLDRKVTTKYRMGHDLTLGLPADLQKYELTFDFLAELTTADLDYIVTWTNATELTVDDHCDAALGLLRRIDAMSAMVNLSYLQLNVGPNVLERLRLRPFFRNLPGLKRIEFNFSKGISDDDIRAFMKRQDIPKGFVQETTSVYSAHFAKSAGGGSMGKGIW